MSVTVEAPKPVSVAARVARLRQVLVEAVTDDDIRDVVKKLVELTKDGDLRAARLLLHYALGKPGDAAFPAAAPRAPRNDARPAPAAAPAFDVKRDQLLGGPTVGDLIRQQIQEERATDNKREKPAQSKPLSVPPSTAFAKTDAMRLVNLPDSKRS